MIAYISLEYSSDGPSPSNIDQILESAGLRRQGAFYYLEVPSEDDLAPALDRLHGSLKGSGVRYRLSEVREQDRPAAEGTVRKESMDVIAAQLRDTGGSNLQELQFSTSMGEEELERALERLIEEGRVMAHFEGTITIYRYAGPMLRSLCR
jgi:hypothetical protein